MTPTIGRIVHYHPSDTPPNPSAAIVTGLTATGGVNLAVLHSSALVFFHDVSMGGPDGTTPTPGCWTWPPRS